MNETITHTKQLWSVARTGLFNPVSEYIIIKLYMPDDIDKPHMLLLYILER